MHDRAQVFISCPSEESGARPTYVGTLERWLNNKLSLPDTECLSNISLFILVSSCFSWLISFSCVIMVLSFFCLCTCLIYNFLFVKSYSSVGLWIHYTWSLSQIYLLLIKEVLVNFLILYSFIIKFKLSFNLNIMTGIGKTAPHCIT